MTATTTKRAEVFAAYRERFGDGVPAFCLMKEGLTEEETVARAEAAIASGVMIVIDNPDNLDL